jgi:hypothetical protein
MHRRRFLSYSVAAGCAAVSPSLVVFVKLCKMVVMAEDYAAFRS